MSATHYTILNITPGASTPLIKAAYKAMVLECHPDKTAQLDPQERAERVIQFRAVQEAYEVLTDSRKRYHYDMVLNKGAKSILTPPAPPSSSSSSQSGRRPSIRKTSDGDREKMKVKVEETLENIERSRQRRRDEEAHFSLDQLRDLLKTWRQVAEERKGTPVDHAYCLIRIHEYEKKVLEKEREKEKWLENMAKPMPHKTAPTKPAPGSKTSQPRAARPGSTKPQTPKTTKCRQKEERRAAEKLSRAEARAREKARHEAVLREHQEAKAQAVRELREKQQQKMDELARQEADRINKPREAAGVTPLRKGEGKAACDARREAPHNKRLTKGRKYPCTACQGEHESMVEWKNCFTAAN